VWVSSYARDRLLSARTPPWSPVRRVGRRRPTYGEPVIRLLAEIWQAAGYLCGPRLKAAIPQWLPWLKRRAAVTLAGEAQLRRISARQIDRRLGEQKRRIKRRLYGICSTSIRFEGWRQGALQGPASGLRSRPGSVGLLLVSIRVFRCPHLSRACA
jgi:hypothetical protein